MISCGAGSATTSRRVLPLAVWKTYSPLCRITPRVMSSGGTSKETPAVRRMVSGSWPVAVSRAAVGGVIDHESFHAAMRRIIAFGQARDLETEFARIHQDLQFRLHVASASGVFEHTVARALDDNLPGAGAASSGWPSRVTLTTGSTPADGCRNTTNTDPFGSSRNGTLVARSFSVNAIAREICPVSGHQNSGSRPVMRKLAVAAISRGSGLATKYTSVSPTARWMYRSRGVALKSSCTPFRANHSPAAAACG